MKNNLEKIIPQQGIDIISEILEKYSATEQTIDDFLHQILTDSSVYSYAEEINQTVIKISATMDAISLAYQDIQAYKNKGLSLNIWLRDNLNKAIQHLPQAEQDTIIDAAKLAMNNGNVALFKQLSNGGTDVNLIADLVSNNFADLNKTAIGNNLKEEIKLNTLLNAIALESISNEEINQECKAAQAYFAAPLDSETDNDLKKVVAAAVEIAKKKNLLADDLANASTEQIAVTVDNGVTAAKVAYKMAEGEISVIDGLDYLIDKAAARVKVVVDTACQTVGSNVGAVIGAALGELFSPAGATLGAKVGRAVGAAAGKKVAEFVSKGVDMVASAAKSVARTVCNVAESVWEGAKSFVSSLKFW